MNGRSMFVQATQRADIFVFKRHDTRIRGPVDALKAFRDCRLVIQPGFEEREMESFYAAQEKHEDRVDCGNVLFERSCKVSGPVADAV